MERREPWYREAAHRVLDCGRASKGELVQRILEEFYAELGVD